MTPWTKSALIKISFFSTLTRWIKSALIKFFIKQMKPKEQIKKKTIVFRYIFIQRCKSGNLHMISTRTEILRNGFKFFQNIRQHLQNNFNWQPECEPKISFLPISQKIHKQIDMNLTKRIKMKQKFWGKNRISKLTYRQISTRWKNSTFQSNRKRSKS